MLSDFQSGYQRVEQSLQRLTDSIAAYNPSSTAADELAAADDTVSEHLKQLVEHQQNYVRIEELKQTTASLDDTIKSQIRVLAELRRDLLSIPASDIDDSRPSFTVDEVLSYAKFISRTTVPPTFRIQDRAAAKPNDSQDSQMTNGMVTPRSGGVAEGDSSQLTENVGAKAMTVEEKSWLDPRSHLSFEPWPSYDVIAQGTLADIQRMRERGVDPASILTAEEQAEADATKKEEEERERFEQEAMERKRAEMFDTGRRKTLANDVFNPDD